MRIILIGFAATGKSSVGALLADGLRLRFADVDSLVENDAHMSVAQIFRQKGEDYFRALESDALRRLTDIDGIVVACGGGSVLSDDFARFAEGSTVIWLTADANTVKSRLCGGRPLFDGLTTEELSRRIAERERIYRRYADVTVSTDGLTTIQTANKIRQIIAL